MRHLLAALLLLLLLSTAVHAEIAVPPPGLVVDQAGVLSAADRQDVETALRSLREAEHGAAMAILVIDHVPDGDIETYALTVGRAWKLGRAGVNDGLLLVHAIKDKRYRFEVGPGLQGDLPDGAIGDIGREAFVPKVKAGDLRGAYVDTVAAIAARLKAATPTPATADTQAASAMDAQAASAAGDDGFTAFLVVAGVIVVLSILLRRRYLHSGLAAAAVSAGTLTFYAEPLAAIATFAVVGGLAGMVVTFLARNPGVFFDFLFNIVLSSSSSSSSSSGSSSSDSSSFGGGDFDGGGASGSTD
ncbi:MAG TPA: TPM domain-containing protein [Magnetospirillum sp.]|nr:TPM domain-containing protein [Magnetospirillum sp.]